MAGRGNPNMGRDVVTPGRSRAPSLRVTNAQAKEKLESKILENLDKIVNTLIDSLDAKDARDRISAADKLLNRVFGPSDVKKENLEGRLLTIIEKLAIKAPQPEVIEGDYKMVNLPEIANGLEDYTRDTS